MPKSHLNNIERSRKARSVQDLVRLTASISKSILACKSVTDKLTKSSPKLTISLLPIKASKLRISLSAKGKDSSTDEISIRHVAGVAPKVAPKSAPSGVLGKDFKFANLKAAEPHASVIDELHEKLQELDSIEAMLLQAFPDAKGQPAALKAVRALKQELDITYDKAFTALTKVSDANLPKELRGLGEDAQEFLESNLDTKLYKPNSIDNYSYVTKTKDGLWNYTYYITIDDLKNSSGFIFHTYYVVLTALIDKQKHATYHLTTLVDFRIPGKFPIGSTIGNTSDLQKKLNILLRHNDIIHVLEKKPLNMDTKGAKSRGFGSIKGVADTSVVDDTLLVKLTNKKPLPQEIADVVKQVMPLLKPLTGNKAKSSDISWKKVPKRGYMELHFIFVTSLGAAGKSSINIEKLKELQHALGLSEEEVDAVKTALHSVHR